MDVKFQFFKEENLLIQKYIGEFSIVDYQNYIDKALIFPERKETFKVLSDFSETNFENAVGLIEELSVIRSEKLKRNFYNVMVVPEPQSMVFATLYQMNQEPEHNCGVCSTLGEAINLLGLNLKTSIIEDWIFNLQNEYISSSE